MIEMVRRGFAGVTIMAYANSVNGFRFFFGQLFLGNTIGD